jgi:hypothetical protein
MYLQRLQQESRDASGGTLSASGYFPGDKPETHAGRTAKNYT